MELPTWNHRRRRKFPLQTQSEENPHSTRASLSESPGEVVGDWEPTGSQYEWDEEGNKEEDTLYHAYEVGTPELGYLKLMRIAGMLYITPTPSPMSEYQLSRNHHPPPKVVQDNSSA